MRRLRFFVFSIVLLVSFVFSPLLTAAVDREEVWNMSNWKLVIPEVTINLVKNPSIEGTSGYTAEATGVLTRGSTYAFFGVYSLRVETSADDDGAKISLATLPNAAHYATVRVRGTLPTAWYWSINGTDFVTPSLIMAMDDNWSLYGASFTAGQSNGGTLLFVYQDGAGSGDFYVDGLQVEQKTYWTTFTSGGRDGCAWSGAEDFSTSSRSGYTHSGGRLQDITDDMGFTVEKEIGWGSRSVVGYSPYSTLPGGSVGHVGSPASRPSLVGVVRKSTTTTLHERRRELLEQLKRDGYPHRTRGPRPIRFWYVGDTIAKYIDVHFEDGVSGAFSGDNLTAWERTTLVFLANDPAWYSIGDSHQTLDHNDDAVVHEFAGRLRSTGAWDDMGLSNHTSGSVAVYVVAEGKDGKIYVGGDFTGWDAIAGANNIAVYDPVTEAWAAFGTFGDVVRVIEVAPNGDVYVGGDFTGANGDGNQDYVCYRDVSAPSWQAMGTPDTGAASITRVWSLAFRPDGKLVVGGEFNNMADIAAADGLALWDPIAGAWSALAVGAGASDQIRCIYPAIDGSEYIYFGGSFTDFATQGSADYAAVYTGVAGTPYSPVSTSQALTFTVQDMDADGYGNIYFVGAQTDILGPANGIFVWTGSQWEPLGVGIETFDGSTGYTVSEVEIAPDDTIYCGGDFIRAGGRLMEQRAARWNGGAWTHIDINLPGAPHVEGIKTANPDPDMPRLYDLYLGFDVQGTAYFAGTTDVVVSGALRSYPTVYFERAGGTSAKIYSLRNEDTGAELAMDYDLQDGEKLTVSLHPQNMAVTSSFYGRRLDAILGNSDVGGFFLTPGTNNISCFVGEEGSPTVTVTMVWKDAYGWD